MVCAELAAAFPAAVFALLLVLGVAQHAITATRAEHGPAPLSRYGGDVIVPEGTHVEIAVLKGLAAAYVMSSASQQPVYEAQEEIIRDLYSRLWHTGTQHLSPLFAELWQQAEDNDARRRVIVDQIASYTEGRLERVHEARSPRPLD